MPEDERIDIALSNLFAAPDAAPDDAFATRVARAIVAEQRIAAVRRASWRRFSLEVAASAAVAAAFVLLGRLAPFSLDPGQPAMTPAIAAALVLGLWFAVELRGTATARG